MAFPAWLVTSQLLFFRVIFSFFITLGASSLALASPSIEDYGALKSVSNMAISPSGKLVAFHKVTAERDAVYVYSKQTKKLITGADVGDITLRNVYFINEKQVIFTGYENRRVMGFRGKMDLSTAFVLNVSDGSVRQLLTPGDGIYKGQAGLGSIVGISPDGKYAYMPAYVAKKNTMQNPDYSLVKARLGNKARPKVVRKGSSNTIDYFVNKKGEVIAEERYSNKTNMHSIYALHGNKWVKIFNQEEKIRDVSIVGLTPDRKSLVVLDEARDTGRVSYMTLSLNDGSISAPIFGRDDADIEAVIVDVNRVVYGVRYSGFRPNYQFFDKKLDAKVQGILAKFPDQSVWLEDWTNSWDDVIIYVEGSISAGTYFGWSKGELSRLGEARPAIAAKDIHPVIKVSYLAEDGMVIPALITVPASKMNALKNLPIIVMPHGGPASYDRMGFDWLSQAFANQGYVVLQPQFRGSKGFGLAHEQAGFGEWGKKMQSDLTDGVKMLIKEKVANPARVCIVGWSYGGYAALAGGAFTPDLYQCVVSINGVADLPKMMKQEKRDLGGDHWAVAYWEKVIANGNTDTDYIKNVSPARFASQFKAPVLLLHGQDDSVVKLEQSRYMKKALEKAGKAVELKVFEGDNHSLVNRENRIEALTHMIEFVNKHIGKAL